jgi:hypothetical protein
MIIDCDRCTMLETEACADCVVGALVGHNGILELADTERHAIEALSRVGLVSPIRLVEYDPPQAVSGE